MGLDVFVLNQVLMKCFVPVVQQFKNPPSLVVNHLQFVTDLVPECTHANMKVLHIQTFYFFLFKKIYWLFLISIYILPRLIVHIAQFGSHIISAVDVISGCATFLFNFYAYMSEECFLQEVMWFFL